MEHELLGRPDFALCLAREAGSIVSTYYYGKTASVYEKKDGSPVTDADRAAEEYLRERIEQRYPDDAILGEEFGTVAGSSGFTWSLDPIDGTKSFVASVPLFTVLISLLHEGAPIGGIIHNPITGETVSAFENGPCRLNGRPTTLRPCSTLSDAMVLVTDPVDLFARRPSFAERLMRSAGQMRTWADGYGYLMVATGRADAMIDPIMNPWDINPMYPVIRQAGGAFADIDGNRDAVSDSAIACAPGMLDEILSLL